MSTIRMPEHQPHQHGDIGEDYNIATLVAVAVVGLIALLWSVVWLKAVFARADHWEWENKVAKAHFTERESLVEGQEQRLKTPAWTDATKGRVSRPVTDVQGAVLMQLSAAQQQRTGRPVLTLPLGGGQTPVVTSPVEPAPAHGTAEAEGPPAPEAAAAEQSAHEEADHTAAEKGKS